MYELVTLALRLEPVFINVHSGHDSWSAAQTLDLRLNGEGDEGRLAHLGDD